MAEFGQNQLPECVVHLRNIDVEDLQYVERDLCFYELVSLGFLLFGTTRANAEFILQKLLVLANAAGQSGSAANLNGNLLRKYASINPQNWRETLVEALAIIDARRVLRKLGFSWEPLRQHYLPHIAEISLHVHPLLKALYKMCERLTLAAMGRLILDINETHRRSDAHLRFYDFSYLEVYMLHWITLGVIEVGDMNANGANVQVLIDYFKLNEMYNLKALLVSTISANAVDDDSNPAPIIEHNGINDDAIRQNTEYTPTTALQDCTSATVTHGSSNNNSQTQTQIATVSVEALHERYIVRKEHAGLILIINQQQFHQDESPDLQHMLPHSALGSRLGTDVDKQRLKDVFMSFGYMAVEYDNITHNDLLYRIGETVNRSFLFDSLLVCILSHGIDGAVYGSNSIPVEISEIEQIVAARTLRGKPKMLIIQACQTNEHALHNIANKSKKRSAPQRNAQSPTNRTDMITAMSTVSGFAAMRHTIEGSWFIEALCKAVNDLGDRKHMLDILTAVQRDVVNRRGKNNELMVPSSSNTLTKDFYLPPRNTVV